MLACALLRQKETKLRMTGCFGRLIIISLLHVCVQSTTLNSIYYTKLEQRKKQPMPSTMSYHFIAKQKRCSS